MMKKTLTALALAMSGLVAQAQNDLIMSQYVHNRYALNAAFGGARECLSMAASYRKQWTGIENTPQSMLLTAHTSLKKEQITLGAEIFNQTIHQSSNSGAMLSIGYRVRTADKQWLSFALQPGLALRSTDWTKVHTIDPDDIFSENVSATNPLLGFGVAWYGPKFFAGVSTTSLFVADDFEADGGFAPDKAQYIATAGILLGSGDVQVQPSVMASYQKPLGTKADITASAIYKDFVWVTAGYRTTKELTIGAAVQALPQLRVAYSYDYTSGDMKGYSTGSHEICIHYDMIFRTRNVGPRFF